LSEAVQAIREALELAGVEFIDENGEGLGVRLDAVMELPDSKGGVAIRVAVKTETPKCIRINVTLPEDILGTDL
jgi:hypothetical protein